MRSVHSEEDIEQVLCFHVFSLRAAVGNCVCVVLGGRAVAVLLARKPEDRGTGQLQPSGRVAGEVAPGRTALEGETQFL